jgi:hypothetical protein
VTRAREHQISKVLYKPFSLAEMEQWLQVEASRCGCGPHPA